MRALAYITLINFAKMYGINIYIDDIGIQRKSFRELNEDIYLYEKSQGLNGGLHF